MVAVDDRTSRNWPLPSPRNMLRDDVTRIRQALQAADGDVTNLLLQMGAKAALVHNHAIADVNGLTEALADKLDADGLNLNLSGLSDVSPNAPTGNQVLMRIGNLWAPASLQINHVANLEASLNSLADTANSKWNAASVSAAPSVTSPTDASFFALVVGGVLKNLTFANLKATLGAVFATKATTLAGYGITDGLTAAAAAAAFVDVTGDIMSGGLQVKDGGSGFGLRVLPNPSDDTGRIQWTNAAANAQRANIAVNASGHMYLSSAAGAMTLFSDGNLLTTGNWLRLKNTNFGVYFDGGSAIGFTGSDGNYRIYVDNAGAIWTSEYNGTISAHIEARAAAFANSRAPYDTGYDGLGSWCTEWRSSLPVNTVSAVAGRAGTWRSHANTNVAGNYLITWQRIA